MLTKTAHALLAWSAHRRSALSPYPRSSCPADTTNSCPSQVAPRATPTALLAHTHPLAASQPKPQTPQHRPPPASVPTAYCRRRAPEQPAAAARRSLAADCESAGSTQCSLAATTWCQRWQPALATCVYVLAPPATPLTARSEWAVAAAAGGGSRDARSSLYERIFQWFHCHRPIALQACVARGRG